MSCKFEFEDYGDRNSLIDEIRRGVKSTGGTFDGDYEKGRFYGSDPTFYEVRYSFDKREFLKLTVNSGIPYPCFLIEKEIRKYLKNREFNITFLLKKEKKMILNEMLDQSMFVKVFGEIIFEIPSESGINFSSAQSFYEGKLYFVHIKGAKLFGKCETFDQPRFFILPGEGKPSNECGFDNVVEWAIPQDTNIVGFSGEVSKASELWDPIRYYKWDAQVVANATKISGSKVRVEYKIEFEAKRRDNRRWDTLATISDYRELKIGADWEFDLKIFNIKLEADLEEACVSVYAFGTRLAKECVEY